MLPYLKKFERVILSSLVAMMVVVIFFSTVELGWLIVKDIITPPLFLFETVELLDIFGMFLLVLIGIELLETIKTYITINEIHVEVVFLVAMIAIARKVITLDVKALDPGTLVGIAAIILSLSVGYFLVKRCWRDKSSDLPCH
jgi:uncharacterized membrane protein (DUF373 family)